MAVIETDGYEVTVEHVWRGGNDLKMVVRIRANLITTPNARGYDEQAIHDLIHEVLEDFRLRGDPVDEVILTGRSK